MIFVPISERSFALIKPFAIMTLDLARRQTSASAHNEHQTHPGRRTPGRGSPWQQVRTRLRQAAQAARRRRGPPDYPQRSTVRLEYLYGLHPPAPADRNAGCRVRELRRRPDRRPDPGPARRRGRADRSPRRRPRSPPLAARAQRRELLLVVAEQGQALGRGRPPLARGPGPSRRAHHRPRPRPGPADRQRGRPPVARPRRPRSKKTRPHPPARPGSPRRPPGRRLHGQRRRRRPPDHRPGRERTQPRRSTTSSPPGT